MYFAMLVMAAVLLLSVLRRVVKLRHLGRPAQARRLYRRTAWAVILLIWLAMACQEMVLVLSGAWTLASGLPLHLCALMGLLTAPMLLREHRLLWHLSVYCGMPGALAALIFPCPFLGSYPRLAYFSFGLLHVLLTLAPLLPLAMGRRPSPRMALRTWCCLALYACVMLAFNALFGTNYLFVSAPPPSLPAPLREMSPQAWLLALCAASAALLTGEALIAAALLRRFPEDFVTPLRRS